MIQKTMESNLPFRPPKSPSSIVNTHVVTPKSPTRRHKSRKHPKEPHYDEDLSDAASPTSVVNNGFRSNQHSHGRSRNKSERRGGAGRAPSPPSQEAASDASLIQSGIQCIQVREQRIIRTRWKRFVCVSHYSHTQTHRSIDGKSSGRRFCLFSFGGGAETATRCASCANGFGTL